MHKYPLIAIDSVYLTDDGTENGARYIVKADNLLGLRLAKRRIFIETLKGGVNQLRSHAGTQIPITVQLTPKVKLDAVIAAIEAAEAANSLHAVLISGEAGEKSLSCLFEGFKWPGEAIGAGLREVEMMFRIISVNE